MGPKAVSEPAQTELARDSQRHRCFRRGSAGGCSNKRYQVIHSQIALHNVTHTPWLYNAFWWHQPSPTLGWNSVIYCLSFSINPWLVMTSWIMLHHIITDTCTHRLLLTSNCNNLSDTSLSKSPSGLAVFSDWSCFQGSHCFGDTVLSPRPAAPGQHPRNTWWNVADDVGVVPIY